MLQRHRGRLDHADVGTWPQTFSVDSCVVMSFYPPFLLDDNILLFRLLLLLEKIYILGKIFLQNFDDVSVSGVWGIIVCVVQVK